MRCADRLGTQMETLRNRPTTVPSMIICITLQAGPLPHSSTQHGDTGVFGVYSLIHSRPLGSTKRSGMRPHICMHKFVEQALGLSR